MVLRKKYKGNTLPEVLIAIVIISFTSALGVSIYINIQENSQPFSKIKAANLAQKVLVETESSKNFIDESIHEDDFTIKKSISRLSDYPDCVLLKITVQTKTEKKAAEIQKIIYAN